MKCHRYVGGKASRKGGKIFIDLNYSRVVSKFTEL